jgi:FKBP-type peptidyl-prolyl cis-trans isomerase
MPVARAWRAAADFNFNLKELFLKRFAVCFLALATSACAAAQDSKSAPDAKPGACKDAPRELVVNDLKQGSGKTVGFRTGAMVFYTGWVYDGCAKDSRGKQFDSNVGKPVPFGVVVGAGRVIKGWDEGLIGMKEGGKRVLVIPPDKAYGERAIGDRIPAHSTLVFEIELAQIGYQPEAAPEKK